MRLKLENYRFPASELGTKSHVKTACDASRWCALYCQDSKLGCAIDCKLRIHFKIPPHGDKFPVEER
jgi:hypothetical protein